MRTIFMLVVSLFGISCLAQEPTLPMTMGELSLARLPKPALRYSVDLAKPGALDRLEKENPEHYAKVLAVQRVASRPSCVEDLKVLKVELELDAANCAAMTTLTSYPPKKHVSLVVDGVLYMTYAPIGFAPTTSVPVPSPGITPPLR